MVSLDDRISDYIALLGDGMEEGKYLRSNPWILDADRQDPDVLIRALSMEAARLQELPVRPSVLAAGGPSRYGAATSPRADPVLPLPVIPGLESGSRR